MIKLVNVEKWYPVGNMKSFVLRRINLEIREGELPDIVDSLLAQGVGPALIIETCREAMSVIGQRFEAGDDVEHFLIDATLAQTMECPVEVLQ